MEKKLRTSMKFLPTHFPTQSPVYKETPLDFRMLKTKLEPWGLSVSTPTRPHIGQDNGLSYVVKLLNFFGSRPVMSYASSSPSGRSYKVKWHCLQTYWAGGMSILFGVVWTIYIFHFSLKIFLFTSVEITSPSHLLGTVVVEDSVENEVIFTPWRVLHAVIPTFQFLAIFWGWFNPKDLVQFLNNWEMLDVEYSRIFYPPSQRQSFQDLQSLTKYERSMKLFNLRLGLMTFLPICISMPIFLSGLKLNLATNIFYSGVFLHFALVELLEDAKNILMYNSLSDAFYKIRLSLRSAVKWEKLTEEKAESWFNLIWNVRGQAELAMKYLKPSQLSFLLNVIVTGSFLVFTCLNGLWNRVMDIRITILCGFYCLLMLVRLFSKVDAADKIVEQESGIAKDFMRLNATRHSPSISPQIRPIFELINGKPTQIHFGSYVTLSKHLVIGVASQIITYLIVLMQFFQSHHGPDPTKHTSR